MNFNCCARSLSRPLIPIFLERYGLQERKHTGCCNGTRRPSALSLQVGGPGHLILQLKFSDIWDSERMDCLYGYLVEVRHLRITESQRS